MIFRQIRRVVVTFLSSILLIGGLYPSVVGLLGKLCFPRQSAGSLIYRGETMVGSQFIGQKFTSQKYFHGRPSRIDYDARLSGGSVLWLGHPDFRTNLVKQIYQVRKENWLRREQAIPAELVMMSASGLDPHISFEGVILQVRRIAKNRKCLIKQLYPLIYQALDRNFAGLWGNEGINVLKLNLLLDEHFPMNK